MTSPSPDAPSAPRLPAPLRRGRTKKAKPTTARRRMPLPPWAWRCEPSAREVIGPMTLPPHPQPHPPLLAVAPHHVALAEAEEAEGARHFDVVASVLLDEVEPSLAHPGERLQAVGGLAVSIGWVAAAGGRGGEVVEAQAEAERAVDVLEQVERGDEAVVVGAGVAAEHAVVEAAHVEDDDEARRAQRRGEGAGVALAIDLEALVLEAADDGDGEAHAVRVAPAADVGGGA